MSLYDFECFKAYSSLQVIVQTSFTSIFSRFVEPCTNIHTVSSSTTIEFACCGEALASVCPQERSHMHVKSSCSSGFEWVSVASFTGQHSAPVVIRGPYVLRIVKKLSTSSSFFFFNWQACKLLVVAWRNY